MDPSYTPDAAAAALTDGTRDKTRHLKVFPYLGVPGGGYQTKPGKTAS